MKLKPPAETFDFKGKFIERAKVLSGRKYANAYLIFREYNKQKLKNKKNCSDDHHSFSYCFTFLTIKYGQPKLENSYRYSVTVLIFVSNDAF